MDLSSSYRLFPYYSSRPQPGSVVPAATKYSARRKNGKAIGRSDQCAGIVPRARRRVFVGSQMGGCCLD